MATGRAARGSDCDAPGSAAHGRGANPQTPSAAIPATTLRRGTAREMAAGDVIAADVVGRDVAALDVVSLDMADSSSCAQHATPTDRRSARAAARREATPLPAIRERGCAADRGVLPDAP